LLRPSSGRWRRRRENFKSYFSQTLWSANFSQLYPGYFYDRPRLERHFYGGQARPFANEPDFFSVTYSHSGRAQSEAKTSVVEQSPAWTLNEWNLGNHQQLLGSNA
jgi:hypothetical protein